MRQATTDDSPLTVEPRVLKDDGPVEPSTTIIDAATQTPDNVILRDDDDDDERMPAVPVLLQAWRVARKAVEVVRLPRRRLTPD